MYINLVHTTYIRWKTDGNKYYLLVNTLGVRRIKRVHLPHSVSGRFATVSASEAFLEDYAKHNVSLSPLQRALLTVGSAVISLANPHRGDMIACLGETTGANALVHCRRRMNNTAEGQRILAQKPRVNTSTVDLSRLRDLPPGTVGRTYRDFLDNNVRKYLAQRSRHSSAL